MKVEVEKEFEKFVHQIYGGEVIVLKNDDFRPYYVSGKDVFGDKTNIIAHAIHNFALYLMHTHQFEALCVVNSWRDQKDML